MNSAIGFFDGFDGVLVAIVYAALVVFSVVFQLIRQKLSKRAGQDDLEEEEEPQVQETQDDNPYLNKRRPTGKKIKNINDSSMISNQSKLLDNNRNTEYTNQ